MASRKQILMNAIEVIRERLYYIYGDRASLPSYLKRLRSRLIHRLLH